MDCFPKMIWLLIIEESKKLTKEAAKTSNGDARKAAVCGRRKELIW